MQKAIVRPDGGTTSSCKGLSIINCTASGVCCRLKSKLLKITGSSRQDGVLSSLSSRLSKVFRAIVSFPVVSRKNARRQLTKVGVQLMFTTLVRSVALHFSGKSFEEFCVSGLTVFTGNHKLLPHSAV